MLQRLLMVVLTLHKELPILLYFESVIIVLIANPNVEAYSLNSNFAAHYRSDFSYVALRH